MKNQKQLILTSILLTISVIGDSQTNNALKWKIDKKIYFTSLRIIESKDNDTVIFLDNVCFHSKLFSIDSVDKIVYCKKSKKLSIGCSKKGSHPRSLKLSKIMRPTILTPITEISDVYSFDELEYIIGEHTYYLK
jgi:hypothetical protein